MQYGMSPARSHLLLSQERVRRPKWTKRHLQRSEGILISFGRNSEGNSCSQEGKQFVVRRGNITRTSKKTSRGQCCKANLHHPCTVNIEGTCSWNASLMEGSQGFPTETPSWYCYRLSLQTYAMLTTFLEAESKLARRREKTPTLKLTD